MDIQRIVDLKGAIGLSGYTPESLCEKYNDRVTEDGRFKVDDIVYNVKYVDDRIKEWDSIPDGHMSKEENEWVVRRTVVDHELIDIFVDRHCRTRALGEI